MKIKRLAWHFTQKCLRWSIVVVCMSCVNRNEVAQYHIKASQVDSLRMPMLVWQAAAAQEIWLGAEFVPQEVVRVISAATAYMNEHFTGNRQN